MSKQGMFDVLRYIVVYPVEDEHQWSDKEGRVLPDAFLIKKVKMPRILPSRFILISDVGYLRCRRAHEKAAR